MTEYEKGYDEGFFDGLKARRRTDTVSQMTLKKKIIEEIVCNHFKLTMEDLRRRTRAEPIKYPRQILTYFLYTATDYNTITLGKYLHQDHTTILSSVRRIKDLLFSDENTQNVVKNIARVIDLYFKEENQSQCPEKQLTQTT